MIVHGEATPMQEVHGVIQALTELLPVTVVLHGEETHGTMAIAEEELLHGATITPAHAVAGQHQVIITPVSVPSVAVVAAVQVAAVPVAEVVDHVADINSF